MQRFIVILVLFIITLAVYQSIKVAESFASNNTKEEPSTILITGSTRGIGFALAEYIVKTYPMTTIIIHGKRQESVDNAMSKLNSKKIKGYAADLSTHEGCVSLITQMQNGMGKTLPLDAVVHCAGETLKENGSIMDLDPKEWEQDKAVHLDAAIYLAQLCKDHLELRQGRMVFISSGAAELEHTWGGAVPASYILAKSSIEKMTRMLAAEWLPYSLAATCLRIDAVIDTEMTNGLEADMTSNDAVVGIMKLLEAPSEVINGQVIALTHVLDEDHIPILRDIDHTAFVQDESEKDTVRVSEPLIAAISNYTRIPKPSITLFNGSLNAIDVLLNWTRGEVLVSDPEWEPLLLTLKKRKIPIRAIPQEAKPDQSIDKFLENMSPHVGMIYLTSPHYLTGQSLTTDGFKHFLNRIPSNVIVVVDQCYIDYVVGPVLRVEELCLEYPQVIGIRTLSKAIGLPALRIAYTVSHPDVALALSRQIISPFLSTAAVDTAIKALNLDHDKLKSTVKRVTEQRESIQRRFKAVYIRFIASETTHMLVDFSTTKAKNKTWTGFKKEGKLIVQDELYYDKYMLLVLDTPQTEDVVNQLLGHV